VRDIIILTQSSCISCQRAKEILSRMEMEFPLNIREVPLQSNEGRILAVRHGVVFAPGILIDGELLSYGRLSENKLRHRLLDLSQ
jgi:glutaredoxin